MLRDFWHRLPCLPLLAATAWAALTPAVSGISCASGTPWGTVGPSAAAVERRSGLLGQRRGVAAASQQRLVAGAAAQMALRASSHHAAPFPATYLAREYDRLLCPLHARPRAREGDSSAIPPSVGVPAAVSPVEGITRGLPFAPPPSVAHGAVPEPCAAWHTRCPSGSWSRCDIGPHQEPRPPELDALHEESSPPEDNGTPTEFMEYMDGSGRLPGAASSSADTARRSSYSAHGASCL